MYASGLELRPPWKVGLMHRMTRAAFLAVMFLVEGCCCVPAGTAVGSNITPNKLSFMMFLCVGVAIALVLKRRRLTLLNGVKGAGERVLFGPHEF